MQISGRAGFKYVLEWLAIQQVSCGGDVGALVL